MDKLIDLIGEFLNIPEIEPNEAVQDGSFQISPIRTDGLRGDGKFCTMQDVFSVNLFYANKLEMMADVKALVNHLIDHKYKCSAPDYTYEMNGGIWRANIQVEV